MLKSVQNRHGRAADSIQRRQQGIAIATVLVDVVTGRVGNPEADGFADHERHRLGFKLTLVARGGTVGSAVKKLVGVLVHEHDELFRVGQPAQDPDAPTERLAKRAVQIVGDLDRDPLLHDRGTQGERAVARITGSGRCRGERLAVRLREVEHMRSSEAGHARLASATRVDLDRTRVQIRRSKTPAGWRDPSLNEACVQALRELRSRASELGFANPEHFLFPYHRRNKEIDPARPMEAWRTAWRSLRAAAGLSHVRFHDGRHTALTRLCEAGQPDWVIQAQMGHVSPAMMKTYSHIRRQALDGAAKSLEPTFALEFPKHDERPREKGRYVAFAAAPTPAPASHVTVASQSDDLDREFREFAKDFGSSGWIRAENAERSEAVEA